VWKGSSPLDRQFSSVTLIDGENVSRIRRTPDKSASEQKEEPAKDQPSVQPQQQQQQQQPAPAVANPVTLNSTFSDVTYSTVHSTNAPATSTIQPSANINYVPKNTMQPINYSLAQSTVDNVVSREIY